MVSFSNAQIIGSMALYFAMAVVPPIMAIAGFVLLLRAGSSIRGTILLVLGLMGSATITPLGGWLFYVFVALIYAGNS